MHSFRKYAMVIATLLLCGMLLLFLGNLRPHFKEVEIDYKSTPVRAITLSRETDARALSQILLTNGYVTEKKDADFISDTLVSRLKRMKLPSLYALQERECGQVPVSVAEREGVLMNKVALSCENLGLADTLPANDMHESKLNLGRANGDGVITVHVYEEESRGKILDKVLKPKKKNCEAVLVCLREYYVDTLENKINEHTDIVGYARTDSLGLAVFSGLERERGYSVLPIRKGYEYGMSKGIAQGKFNRDSWFRKTCEKEFEFEQREHCIQLIDNATLKQIKNDGTITVRTPMAYKAEVIKWFLFVLAAWWVLAYFWFRRKRKFDNVLVAVTMFLTELCVMTMFSIQNPLTGELKGVEMASGVLMGIGVIALLQGVNFIDYYTGQYRYRFGFDLPTEMIKWLFSPFMEQTRWSRSVLVNNAVWYKKAVAVLALVLTFVLDFLILPLRLLLKLAVYLWGLFKFNRKISFSFPKGFGWLLLALFLTVLLFFFGKEVGGMRVNLQLPGLPMFQPSEIAKYLILFFMAAYFSQNADTIIAYSQPGKIRIMDKVRVLAWAIGGLLLLMFLYYCLGDMGPALVIGVTFVLLYSLVKSKVNLENLTDGAKLKKIFTCDFAMLIYGVVSFAVFILVGYLWAGMRISLLFAGLWFVAWFLYGKIFHKQFFETAVIFNVLIAIFVFGGVIAKNIPAIRDTDLGERFEQRTDMCVNTWGNLDIDLDNPNYKHGKDAKPVSNTQVAHGLWAIASGGLTGRGMGKGNPSLIPAYQTDMILSSMAEQVGWMGLVLVLCVFTVLLGRIVKIGYYVKHPFAFYFCMGMAIVTSVQLFVIALGSSGMIPLTGITVPFLSYGRVSMILNLTALGVVLSLSKNSEQKQLTETQKQIQNHSVGDYNYTSGIVKYAYLVIAVFTLGVWAYYGWGCLARNKTLVHPAYVLTSKGWPMIEYNPRIALLTKEMWAGNIYDRKGVLLATSDKNILMDDSVRNKLEKSGLENEKINRMAQARTKRYYPFAEQLFFMLGDQNSGLFFSYDEQDPRGYMAEVQHLSYLRDFDNLHDKKGRAMPNVILSSNKVKAHSKYLNYNTQGSDTLRVYDYHELTDYLKKGIHGRPLRRHNNKVKNGKYDLFLTIDAKLQKDIQDRIGEYVQSTSLKDKKLLRVSVVVLDAKEGDLLASANYPLPDYQRLREESAQGHEVYSDNCKERNWRAYTDRDLGLTFQTMPGSSAKLMSAMAGLQKLGPAAADITYLVTKDDIIERGKAEEPYQGKFYSRHAKAVDRVDMWWAIVESSNCYFINLVNSNDLYGALDKIYEAAGVGIGGVTPYFLTNDISAERQNRFREKILKIQMAALDKYAKRLEEGVHKKMNEGEWRWAWGQGFEGYELQASPLNMARVASAVINKGKMPRTQYVLPKNKYSKGLRDDKKIKLLSPKSAKVLKQYMQDESANQAKRQSPSVVFPSTIGGKTGTPERNHYISRSKMETLNDGWYTFFVEGEKGKNPLAVCVRIERGSGSGNAVRLAKMVVLESLYVNGYVNR